MEVVYVREQLGGAFYRMNTVFKFYFQVWWLFAVAGAAGAALLAGPSSSSWRTGLGRAAVALLVLAGLLYPARAVPQRVRERFTRGLPVTLDAEQFLWRARYRDPWTSRPQTPYPLRDDYEAIRWLRTHVRGTPVVLEGVAAEYRWGSRISVYTGLPAVLGWSGHQLQQRGNEPIREARQHVRQMYESPDPARKLALLRQHAVRYVVVGALERSLYPAAGLAAFDALLGADLAVVFQSGGTTIYRVAGAGG